MGCKSTKPPEAAVPGSSTKLPSGVAVKEDATPPSQPSVVQAPASMTGKADQVPAKNGNEVRQPEDVVSKPGVKFDFEVFLQRKQVTDRVGVYVDYPTDHELVVQIVREAGLIPLWNKAHMNEPDVQVRVGDIIVDVNGINNDVITMMDAATKEESVSMKIRRGDGKPYESPYETTGKLDTSKGEVAEEVEVVEVVEEAPVNVAPTNEGLGLESNTDVFRPLLINEDDLRSEVVPFGGDKAEGNKPFCCRCL